MKVVYPDGQEVVRSIDLVRLAAAMRAVGVRSEPEFGFVEQAASAIADAYYDLANDRDNDPLAGVPEEMGREWIREQIAEMRARDDQRASEVRTKAGRSLLTAGRTVVVERGLATITVVDGDVLDFIKAIEREVAR